MENIERSIGEILGFSKIWLSEREEMLRARKEIFERLGKLESNIGEAIPHIKEIHAQVKKTEEMRNRIIGAAIVISFLFGIIGAVMLKILDQWSFN